MKKELKKLPVAYYEERDRWSGPESLNYAVCKNETKALELVKENKASHTAPVAPECYTLCTYLGFKEVSDDLYEAVMASDLDCIRTEPKEKYLLLWTNPKKEKETPVKTVAWNEAPKKPFLSSTTPTRKEVEAYLAGLAAYEQYLRDELEALK